MSAKRKPRAVTPPALDYTAIIARKSASADAVGIVIDRAELAPHLFDHQRDLVAWALRRGRSAIFADTGLGKGPMLLEWAKQVSAYGRVLVLAPLAVGPQLEREAKRFGVAARYVRKDEGDLISIANYEMLHAFDASKFTGIVLDESSILKSFNGRTRNELIQAFKFTPYRLACTATPAPNDFTELGNHSEFLGLKTRTEMLAEYFVHDGGSTQDWRIKGHALVPFWRWVATWGAVVKMPHDLGYDDGAFQLPPVEMVEHVVATTDHDHKASGMLFAMEARTLQEQRAVRRGTIDARVRKVAEIIKDAPDQTLIWCDLNEEGDDLEASIPGSVQVSGSDSNEWKEIAIAWFRGAECVCGSPVFRAKLSAWESEMIASTNAATTGQTSPRDSLQPSNMAGPTKSNARLITRSTTPPTASKSLNRLNGIEPEPSSNVVSNGKLSTPQTRRHSNSAQRNGSGRTRVSGSTGACDNTGSPSTTTSGCSEISLACAPSADGWTPAIGEVSDSTLIIATGPGLSVGCSVPTAITDSASSRMTSACSSEPFCICGHRSGRRVLISKTSIFGFGINLQNCNRMVFVGASHSYERTYQSIRRCWRFGQLRPVTVHMVRADLESAVVENYRRKETDAEKMAIEMTAHVGAAVRAEVRGLSREFNPYQPAVTMIVPSWIGA